MSGATHAPSPAQVPQGPAFHPGGGSMDTLVSQMATSQDSAVNVQNQLKTKNLRLSRSQEFLLQNKLSDASTHLRAVNGKLGIEAPPMPAPSGSGPIQKFIAYVADGENQLRAAKQQVASLRDKGESINPADFMLLQIKLNQAQQELEYSSTLLGKVITSLTQILNTQL